MSFRGTHGTPPVGLRHPYLLSSIFFTSSSREEQPRSRLLDVAVDLLVPFGGDVAAHVEWGVVGGSPLTINRLAGSPRSMFSSRLPPSHFPHTNDLRVSS